MNRTVKSTGKLAVAACAATALLVGSPRQAGAQDPVVPLTGDPARIVVPGAPANVNVIQKRTNRTLTVIRADAVVQPAPLMLPGAQLGPQVNAAQMARTTIEQLRPIFQRELRLLTSSAEPTASQRREIALEAGRTLTNAAVAAPGNVKFLIVNGDPAQAVRMSAPAGDPAKLVRQHLEMAAWSKLSNVQSARYRTELDRKEQARREVVILNVVANIDKHLGLTTEQRDKVCLSLREHWDERDYPVAETSFEYDKYVMIIPDQYMLSTLTDEQAAVWRVLPKYHYSSIRSVVAPNAVMTIPLEADEDEDVKAAFGQEGPK